MTDASFDWPMFLRQLEIREHAWNGRRVHYPRADAVPFMPYSLQLFTGLLMDAVAAAPSWAAYNADGDAQRVTFLDVGCGPGTKMLLAEQLFDLDVVGIDIVPEFIAEARDWDLKVAVQDAFALQNYADFAIVLVNRPSSLQDDLESLVMSRMRPGAILIALNWRNQPSRQGWHVISEEWGEPVRGVYAKPSGFAHLGGSIAPGAVTACCGLKLGELPEGDTISPDRIVVTCPGLAKMALAIAAQPDDGGFIPDPTVVG